MTATQDKKSTLAGNDNYTYKMGGGGPTDVSIYLETYSSSNVSIWIFLIFFAFVGVFDTK